MLQLGGPSMVESHSLLNQVLNDFQTLTRQLEGAIEAFARDEREGVDLGPLYRARDAALRGAKLARIGLAKYQRAA